MFFTGLAGLLYRQAGFDNGLLALGLVLRARAYLFFQVWVCLDIWWCMPLSRILMCVCDIGGCFEKHNIQDTPAFKGACLQKVISAFVLR